MDEYLLEIFQDELHTQCQFIVIGARLANANLGPPGTKGNLRAVWFALQGLLVAASNASKLLWGSRQEPLLEARRPLRESVGVDDSSPLSSRRVRNDFEHFDERLEVRFGGGKRGRYLGRNIGPADAIQFGQAATDVFGHFDPYAAMVSFWDNSADLNAIVAEAERILGRVEAIKNRRSRP